MKKLKELPKFKNEDEEREFWATHSFSDYYDIKKFKRMPPVSAKTPGLHNLRLSPEMEGEVQRLSQERKVGVQEMIQQLLAAGIKQQRLQPGA
jgi:hypothetical protein